MANEKRLIDANALELEPDPWGGMNGVICLGRSGGKNMATVQAALRRMIENAPTVDAVEVVHGRWCKDGDWLVCLNCESEINVKNSLGVENRKNYCPNCGADMRERKDDA